MEDKNNKILIFTGTKRVADEITRFLRQDGWPALSIHGDKQQNERDWVLNEFKTGKSPIMVATDVASRGIGMIDSLPSTAHSLLFSMRSSYPLRVASILACRVLHSVRLTCTHNLHSV
jgi:ATP-dependent RNA helicase DDX5/DBP2